MADNDDRLMRCFAATFPGTTRNGIEIAKFETIPGWDSLRGVTLLAVLDEEFGVQIDMTKLLELGTLDAVKQYLIDVM